MVKAELMKLVEHFLDEFICDVMKSGRSFPPFMILNFKRLKQPEILETERKVANECETKVSTVFEPTTPLGSSHRLIGRRE